MAEKFEPGHWPRDPHGYVFLGRAFDQVGAATFKAEWTNREKTASLPVLLPETMPIRSSVADRLARALLHIHVPEFKARLSRLAAQQRVAAVTRAQNASRSIGQGSRFGWSFPTGAEVAQAEQTLQLTDALTVDEWQTARELNKRAFEAAIPLWERAVHVREAMIRGLESGNLEAFIREKAGGEMVPMPAVWWNTDIADTRFVRGDIDPHTPFSAASNPTSWIFISEKSFAKYVASRSSNPVRVGAPEKYDWEDAKWFAIRELQRRGDFNEPGNRVPGWKSQNDLVQMTIKYLAKHSDGEEPAESGVKAKIRDWLAEWRLGQQ
jgi:hypothetical protein